MYITSEFSGRTGGCRRLSYLVVAIIFGSLGIHILPWDALGETTPTDGDVGPKIKLSVEEEQLSGHAVPVSISFETDEVIQIENPVPHRSLTVELSDSSGQEVPLTALGRCLAEADRIESSGATAVYVGPDQERASLDLNIAKYYDLSFADTYSLKVSVDVVSGGHHIRLVSDVATILVYDELH